MKHHRIICIGLLVGLLVTAVTLTASVIAQEPEAILYEEDFDNGPAPDWELEPGWQVVREGGNWMLAGAGHQWAYSGQEFASDFRLQFRLKLVQGRIHLVYRLNDDGRYFIGFDESGSDLSKQYWPDTFLEGLVRSDTPNNLGEWRQIEIDGQGGRIRFLVDGALAWEYDDDEPLLGGSFAFETLDDSVAYVDDIVVFGPAAEVISTQPPATNDQQPLTNNQQLTWVRTGGPLGGLGYDIRMRPDNPDVMVVTDAWAGVHKSNDGGRTWFPINEGITTRAGESGDAIPVFTLAIDPHDYDTLWIGTQNVRGIFKSSDGGQTWVEMDHGVVEKEGITFRGFAVDPRTSDTVYAAAELSSWVWSGQERRGREFDMTGGVVYKTTDGGQNWTAVWRGNNLARYIWIDPANPDVVYLSTGIFDREAANSVPESGIPGGAGVLKSSDGGQTWQPANNGLNNLYVGTLFMHPQNPAVLLAGTGNNQYFQASGVYLSTDGGASWQQTLSDDNINAIEFASSDPKIAYAGSAGAVYRSDDGGLAWQTVSGGDEFGWGPPGVRAGFPIDFQVDPRDPNRIFANNYGGGNFVSSDGGRTWAIASQGYTGAQVRDIAVDSAVAGRVFAAARSGLFVSHGGGAEWTGLNVPPAAAMEWYVVALDPTDWQHVLAANNWNGTILESSNGGQVWRQASPPAGEGKSWRAIVFAPADPQTVYAGTSAFYTAGTFDDRMPAGGVYVSHDRGASWQAANDSLAQDANVTALAVDPQDSLVVYAATGNRGLLKTSDGGQSWTAVSQGLPDSLPLLAIAHHPSQPVLFTGLERAGLYRSGDGGLTWQPSGAGLNPESSISDIIFDPTNAQVLVAADKLSGVYRSADGGATWTAVNNGLRNRSVNALALSGDGRHLYAATEGEGVFRLDLAGPPPPAQPTSQPEGTPVVESGPAAGTQFPVWPIIGGTAVLLLALLALFWRLRCRR